MENCFRKKKTNYFLFIQSIPRYDFQLVIGMSTRTWIITWNMLQQSDRICSTIGIITWKWFWYNFRFLTRMKFITWITFQEGANVATTIGIATWNKFPQDCDFLLAIKSDWSDRPKQAEKSSERTWNSPQHLTNLTTQKIRGRKNIQNIILEDWPLTSTPK